MDERPVLTLHLPIQVDQIARLAEVLEELWPDCRLRPLPSGDLLITTTPATDDHWYCDAQTPGAQPGQLYRCTRRVGHVGDHRAYSHGSVIAEWKNDHG